MKAILRKKIGHTFKTQYKVLTATAAWKRQGESNRIKILEINPWSCSPVVFGRGTKNVL